MEMVDFLAVWSRLGVYSVPIKGSVLKEISDESTSFRNPATKTNQP